VAKASKKVVPTNCEVSADDLQRLGAIHNLLAALNDPLASRRKLQMLTSLSPVLTARIVRHAQARSPSIDTLGAALTLIGNRGLEAVLLQFLEDLTVYKHEQEANPGKDGG
jgi:hypothetical protein